MKVTIYRAQDEGPPLAVATVESHESGPTISGETGILHEFTVVEPDKPSHLLTQKDGDAWIAALPYNLSGSYVWAELTEGVDPYAD